VAASIGPTNSSTVTPYEVFLCSREAANVMPISRPRASSTGDPESPGASEDWSSSAALS